MQDLGHDAAAAAASDRPRIKRPLPPREKPLRGALYAFRPAFERNAEKPRAEEARGVVESAVETAYRVYEEYLIAGQRAAARRESARTRRTPVEPFRFDAPANGKAWVELWWDMYRQWSSAFVPFMNGGPSQGYGPQPSPADGYARPPAYSSEAVSSAPAISVEVDTTRRVQVRVHLIRQPGREPLTASLHHEAEDGRLRVSLDASQIRLAVGDSQQAGTYSGVIRDASGEQIGMITAIVYPSAHG